MKAQHRLIKGHLLSPAVVEMEHFSRLLKQAVNISLRGSLTSADFAYLQRGSRICSQSRVKGLNVSCS